MEHGRKIMNKPILAIILTLATAFIFAACDKGDVMDGPGMFRMPEYKQIDQETAKEMMEQDDGHVIVDVRRQDEYDAGHIPGAICIPNESIEGAPPEELPDFQQVILVYCRSGVRSKEAAKKLADMGYWNVYEFGGILEWTGEVVVEDPMDETATDDETEPETAPFAELVIEAGGKTFYAKLENNSSAEAFVKALDNKELTIDMTDYGGFEKVGDLPWELPRNDESITTQPGDIILYQGNKITIYYGENTWDFTRLARITGVTREKLLEALGEGDVTVTFFIDWSEN